MDDEGVERQKQGDGGPFVVVVPVEVDEGEQVAAHIAARQQGVENPEDEYLQHHSCQVLSHCSQLKHLAKPSNHHSCETVDTGTHYRSFALGRGGSQVLDNIYEVTTVI